MAYGHYDIDPGPSPTLQIAVDVIAGQGWPTSKLIDPTAGSTTPIGVESNPLRARPPATLGYHAIAAASNNAANIKNSAGVLFAVHVFNNTTYPVYVKLYNKASSPTPASDTPVLTIGVQAGTPRDVLLTPKDFPTGISIAMVKNIADNDNTSLAASDCTVDVEYL
jgi:hypothetical protein